MVVVSLCDGSDWVWGISGDRGLDLWDHLGVERVWYGSYSKGNLLHQDILLKYEYCH